MFVTNVLSVKYVYTAEHLTEYRYLACDAKSAPSGRQNSGFYSLLRDEIHCFVLRVELHFNKQQGVYNMLK